MNEFHKMHGISAVTRQGGLNGNHEILFIK